MKRTFFKLREGVGSDDVAFETIGYADQAIASYELFKQLKDEGTIPAATRFQVSLPTPVAFLSGFIVRQDRAAAEGGYERAMKAEIDRIVDAVHNDELALQWDVCYEVVGHDGGYELHYDDVLANSLERWARCWTFGPVAGDVCEGQSINDQRIHSAS